MGLELVHFEYDEKRIYRRILIKQMEEKDMLEMLFGGWGKKKQSKKRPLVGVSHKQDEKKIMKWK